MLNAQLFRFVAASSFASVALRIVAHRVIHNLFFAVALDVAMAKIKSIRSYIVSGTISLTPVDEEHIFFLFFRRQFAHFLPLFRLLII